MRRFRRVPQWIVFAMAAAFAAACIGQAGAGVPSQTVTPVVASPSPSPSLSPSPPTSALASREGTWTPLRWPAPSYLPDRATFQDVVAWRGGYVAVGQVAGADVSVGAAFVSTDGLRWERTTDGSTFSGIPGRIVATAARLIAFGGRSENPEALEAWSSVDGRIWQLQDSLAMVGAGVVAIAGRDRTIVATGNDSGGHTTMWRSIGPPAHWGFASANGTQAVILAFGGVGADPEGWTSFDGREWASLKSTGDVTHIPVTQQFLGMTGHIDQIFVTPRGVLVIGQVVADQSSTPAAWFAEASTH